MSDRPNFLQHIVAMGAGALSVPRLFGQKGSRSAELIRNERRPGRVFTVPVQTPNVSDLRFTMDNGAKVFHLIAEPVKQQIAPNRTFALWGFNGSAPEPTIQVTRALSPVIADNHTMEFSVTWLSPDLSPHPSQAWRDSDGNPAPKVVKP